MALEDFKAIHLSPGSWEKKLGGTIYIGSSDFHRRPPGEDWEWKSDLDCKELFKSVITQCGYYGTIAGIPSVHSEAMFVDGKLAVIGVWYTSSTLMRQTLVDQLGPPARIPVTGSSNRDLSALRWGNGVSVVEFQEHYCGGGIWIGDINRQTWSKDITEVLRGSYCENDDAGNFGYTFIWYVHRSLFSLTMTRWKG
jgi:hypothetical protein